jgi:hypothetical protein
LLGYVILYAAAALVREAMAIWYYREIIAGRALLASIAGGLIEIVDLTVLSSLVILLTQTGGFRRAYPAMAYVIFGSLGVYLGVKFRGRRRK